jgi:hypothetical protein
LLQGSQQPGLVLTGGMKTIFQPQSIHIPDFR